MKKYKIYGFDYAWKFQDEIWIIPKAWVKLVGDNYIVTQPGERPSTFKISELVDLKDNELEVYMRG